MERVIDPIVADLRHEHAEACRLGRRWRSRWIAMAGRIALLKVLAICGTRRLVWGRDRDVGDAESLRWRRAAMWAVVVGVGVTMLFQAPLVWAGWTAASARASASEGASPAATLATATSAAATSAAGASAAESASASVPSASAASASAHLAVWTGRLWVALVAMPSALPIGLLCGFVLGVFYGVGGGGGAGRAGAATSRRVAGLVVVAAVVCGVASFSIMSWITPASNYAYLVAVDGRDLPRGVNELTTGELRERLDAAADARVRLAGRDDRRFVETMYYTRGAFAGGAVALGLLALAMWRWPSAVRMAGGVVACGVYVAYFFWLTNLPRLDAVSPFAAAWLPNLLIALLAITWMASRGLWSRGRSVPDRR